MAQASFQLPASSFQNRTSNFAPAGSWQLEAGSYTVPVRIPSRLIPCTAIAVVLALSVAAAGQLGPSTGAPPGPRTGMIVGQVIDRATGQPASEAIVTLTMPKYQPDLE